MTEACEQVARTLESVARIIRAVGKEAMVDNPAIAEVGEAIARIEAEPAKPPRKKPGRKPQAALPAPERKKPGRKPKDWSGPRKAAESTDDSQPSQRTPVRQPIVDYLQEHGKATLTDIVEATGVNRHKAYQSLNQGLAAGVFCMPQTGYWALRDRRDD